MVVDVLVVDVGLVGVVVDVGVGFVGVDVDDGLVEEVGKVVAVVDDGFVVDDDDVDFDVDVDVDVESSPPFLSFGSTTTTEGSEDAGTGSSFEM